MTGSWPGDESRTRRYDSLMTWHVCSQTQTLMPPMVLDTWIGSIDTLYSRCTGRKGPETRWVTSQSIQDHRIAESPARLVFADLRAGTSSLPRDAFCVCRATNHRYGCFMNPVRNARGLGAWHQTCTIRPATASPTLPTDAVLPTSLAVRRHPLYFVMPRLLLVFWTLTCCLRRYVSHANTCAFT